MHRAVTSPSLRRTVGALLALGAASAASAQQVGPSSAATAEMADIVVTGSLIRRTDAETASPVTVLSAEDLIKSGYTDISDVLRNISANGANNLSQGFNGAFAAGASGVSLRGLSVGATLTLIDGHKMVGYPLTDDGERNFVDLAAIPFNAVERIEVLKDGASAEYGSNALAGVVNIILKKNYTGAEVSAEVADTTHNDGKLVHVGALLGAGDLASDGYNWYVTSELRHQGQVLLGNRSGLWTNFNWTDFGGLNGTPGAGSNPLVSFPLSTTGYVLNPNGNDVTYLPGCTAAQQAADQCTFVPKGLQIQPATGSANLLSKLTKKLANDWQSITTASVFHTTAQQSGGYSSVLPNPFTFIGYPQNGNPTLHNYPTVTLPANYPGNPYGAPAAFVYTFANMGSTITDVHTETYRLVEELNGHTHGWDVSLSAGLMYSHLAESISNSINPTLLQNALNNGYLLGSGHETSLFAPPGDATSTSALYYVSANGSHRLTSLPGGDLMLAVGAEINENKDNASAPPASVAGTQSFNNAWALGSQTNQAIFTELDAPVSHSLDLNAAVRYDRYNTGSGGQATPKVGFKYTPVQSLSLRGTWGKGFRAPSIPELNSGLAFGAGSITDPLLCPNYANGVAASPGNFPSQCQAPLSGVQPGNRALKPEKTTNLTLGAVWEPLKNFSVTVDYYNIKINQDIISAFEAGNLGVNVPGQELVRGPAQNLTYIQPDGTATIASTGAIYGVGPIAYLTFPYLNASSDETSGIDVDARYKLDLGSAGSLTATATFTHMISYKLTANGTSYELAGTHGPSGVSGDTGNPRDRGNVSLTWDRDALSLTATINYVSSFSVVDPSVPYELTCVNAIAYGNGRPNFLGSATIPSSFCNVASFTDVDLYARYNVSDRLQVHASVVNAFNKAPPVDLTTYGSVAAFNPSFHQAGAIGTLITVGANYKFR
jgi:iron complex outermembrane recepter protein